MRSRGPFRSDCSGPIVLRGLAIGRPRWAGHGPKPTFRIPQALLSFEFGSRERARDGARRARALAGFSGHGFKFGAVIGETRGGRRAAVVTAWAAGQG